MSKYRQEYNKYVTGSHPKDINCSNITICWDRFKKAWIVPGGARTQNRIAAENLALELSRVKTISVKSA